MWTFVLKVSESPEDSCLLWGGGLKKICFVTIAGCCQVGLACDCYFGISVCRSSSSGTITALAILGMGAHLRPSLWPYWLSIPWVAIPNSGHLLGPQQSPFPYCLPDKALPEGWKSSFSPPLVTLLSTELTCKNPLHGPNTLYFIFLIGGNCIRYSLPVQLKVCFMLSQVYIKLCFKEKLFFKMPTEV